MAAAVAAFNSAAEVTVSAAAMPGAVPTPKRQHDAARHRNGQQDNRHQAARSLPMLQIRLLHSTIAGRATTARHRRGVDELKPVAM